MTNEQIAAHKVSYFGFSIEVKQDFGGQPHLIDGMPCMWGFVVTKDGCNAMPGATWFQTVQAAKDAVDVLEAAGAERFWEFHRAARDVAQRARAEFLGNTIAA